MERLSTLIVGGGISGLTMALALARRGRPAHVVEKAPEFGEIGAGLQLAPNALWVLDELGVMAEIAKYAVFPSRLVWMDALTAQPITAIDVGERFRRHYGQPYIVMHRSDLLNVLLAACQAEPLITLEAGRDVAEVEDGGDYARARMVDGSTLEAGVVIGADGLWSRVRRLLTDDVPIGSHHVAYRGTIPMDRMSAHAGLDSVVMWVGPEMHFVQYPIRRGELYNQVAVFRSPRHTPDSDDWGTPEELDAHFAETCEYVRDCIRLMWRDKRWPMFDCAPIGTWTRNRVAVVGDAAHPMLQYIAQGACQAIESALSLAKHLAARPDAPAAALRDYQEARKLRTARVQLTARAMGSFFHLDGIAAQVRNQIMSGRAADDFSMIDWLYGHRV